MELLLFILFLFHFHFNGGEFSTVYFIVFFFFLSLVWSWFWVVGFLGFWVSGFCSYWRMKMGVSVKLVGFAFLVGFFFTVVHSAIPSRQKLQVRKHLNRLNKPSVKTILVTLFSLYIFGGRFFFGLIIYFFTLLDLSF